jgi:uncharacterized protein with HEPN domain
MQRDRAYVVDILEAARRIQSYIAGIDYIAFKRDLMRQDAVVKRLEVIGEITKRLSDEFKQSHPSVAWHEIAGMRNILIHEYDKINADRVWTTATHSIPQLIAALEATEKSPPDEDQF